MEALSVFGWLKAKARASDPPPVVLAKGRGFTFDVVGEGAHQEVLTRLCGGKTEDGVKHECAAILRPTNNEADAEAVEVEIEGRRVAYFPREQAGAYRRRLAELGLTGRPATCRAKIVGGWRREDGEGSFGVKLSLAWPVKPAA